LWLHVDSLSQSAAKRWYFATFHERLAVLSFALSNLAYIGFFSNFNKYINWLFDSFFYGIGACCLFSAAAFYLRLDASSVCWRFCVGGDKRARVSSLALDRTALCARTIPQARLLVAAMTMS
jgi:hypothetical protein